jgi:hypothetical protein
VRLRNIFSFSKTAPPAPEAPKGGPRAFRGNTFRTVKMRAPESSGDASGEWLQAAIGPDRNAWTVFKCMPPVMHLEDGVLRDDIINTATYREHLDFMGALSLLAEYEVGQIGLGWSAAENAETIGYRHYEAFGRREGIAFDAVHLPVPPAEPFRPAANDPYTKRVGEVFLEVRKFTETLPDAPDADTEIMEKLKAHKKRGALGMYKKGI